MERRIYKYITGILQNKDHKMISINGMSDHVHILFGMRPSQSLSDLMKDIKGNSSKWINEKSFVKGKFSWQEGYAAFSYSKSQLPNVIKYIEEQEKHHTKRTFMEEYLELLKLFEIEYDERFVFKPIE